MATERIELGAPVLRRLEDGRHELGIMVDGREVVIRSAAALAETADGAVCAFFLPALAVGKTVSSAAPIDRMLMDNLGAAAEIARSFWGYSGPLPEAPLTDRRVPSDVIGQFFTGGVDSFYTLRRNLQRVQCLVNVHGFDIMLSDTDRFAWSRALLQRVADRLSLRLISVETDLRQHPLFQTLSWEVTHVAALASIAHALAPGLGQVHVASSDVPPPWGSHPSLDRLWSSAAVTLINDEEGVRRLDKVKAIADWELVHDSLKVCWENRTADLNCGFCEKCVRTQAQFAVAGHLADLRTFPEGDLVTRINRLRSVNHDLAGQWRDIRGELDDPDLRRAIDRLLRRSPIIDGAKTLLRRAGLTRRRLRRVTFGLAG